MRVRAMRARAVALWALAAPVLASCAKQAGEPLGRISLDPPAVFVSMNRVLPEHPYRRSFLWRHEPRRPEGLERPPLPPIRTDESRLASRPAGATSESDPSPLKAARQKARLNEGRAVDDGLQRAQTRQSDFGSFIAEERLMTLADEVDNLRAQIRSGHEQDIEVMRSAGIEEIAQLRMKALRTGAIESAAKAARRRAAFDGEIQRIRERISSRTRVLETEMQQRIEAGTEALRAKAVRDIAQAQERTRSEPLKDFAEHHKSLDRDWQAPVPATVSPMAPPAWASEVQPDSATVHEPKLAPGRIAGARTRLPLDLPLVDDWSRKETRALIEQWAKLHRYKLVGFSHVPEAEDKTDDCLAWLRSRLWKRVS